MATLEHKYLKEEIELKEKYLEIVFEAAEKSMTKSHAEQVDIQTDRQRHTVICFRGN